MWPFLNWKTLRCGSVVDKKNNRPSMVCNFDEPIYVHPSIVFWTTTYCQCMLALIHTTCEVLIIMLMTPQCAIKHWPADSLHQVNSTSVQLRWVYFMAHMYSVRPAGYSSPCTLFSLRLDTGKLYGYYGRLFDQCEIRRRYLGTRLRCGSGNQRAAP